MRRSIPCEGPESSRPSDGAGAEAPVVRTLPSPAKSVLGAALVLLGAGGVTSLVTDLVGLEGPPESRSSVGSRLLLDESGPADSAESSLVDRVRDVFSGEVLSGLAREVLSGDLGTARADSGPDADEDGLPDEIERLLGTYVTWADSDGDGFSDGFEFVLDSDPLDGASLPVIEPGVQVLAHEDGAWVRVFVAVFPGNLHLVQNFQTYLASPQLQNVGLGDRALPVLPATNWMASSIVEVSFEPSNGLQLLGFTFVLPTSLVDSLSPLSIGLATKLAGEVRTRELVLLEDQGVRYVLGGARAGLGPGGATFSLLPLATGGGGGQDPEWCEMDLGQGVPYGTAGVEQTVEGAGCVARGVLTCVDDECEARIGTTVLHLDQGFLYDQVDD